MNGIQEKSIERLFLKIDNLQSALSKTNEALAVLNERQIQSGKDLISINQSMEKNHHRLRCDNERKEKEFNVCLSGIKERISQIETYSRSPSIIGQFITRNKVWIFAGMVAIIGAIGEAGRILYKMPPPHL